jgi:hypothetical protein
LFRLAVSALKQSESDELDDFERERWRRDLSGAELLRSNGVVNNWELGWPPT